MSNSLTGQNVHCQFEYVSDRYPRDPLKCLFDAPNMEYVPFKCISTVLHMDGASRLLCNAHHGHTTGSSPVLGCVAVWSWITVLIQKY